jgi:hypothetical protein
MGLMGWEQVGKQFVEAMTHMEAMGTCVTEPNLFLYKYPTFSTSVILHTYSPMEMEEMVDWGRGYGATTPSHLGL